MQPFSDAVSRAHAAPREAARLAALDAFDVLDTPRERDFDDVAALASEICETPIAVVNLIGDGRQFFKAEVGLGVRETPLDSSFCAKAILEEDFLVVPDATKDPRFDCNPLVTGEPGLRFYAGALLKTADGHAIGTVCVLDFRPRGLSALQERTLRTLARQVMKQLELRRLLLERERAQADQKLLNLELGHRMKNTLAMVSAMAAQTFRAIPDRTMLGSFDLRLSALASAHDILLRENWTAAPLAAIVCSQVQVHADAGRFTVEGPDLELGPRTTVSISLLLHELATNALKHGALSQHDGRVTVSWRVTEDEEPELELTWRETGGPTPSPAERRGFGSRLIDMGLAGQGGSERRFGPEGLVAAFRAPLAALQRA